MNRRWLALAAVPLALLPLTSCISMDSLGARPLDFECGATDLAGLVSTPRVSRQFEEIQRDAGGDFPPPADKPYETGFEVQDVGFLESVTEGQLREDPVYRSLDDALGIKILESPEAAPEPLRVLMLSGGGQWGAFGAGFLDKLHETHKLPKFDLITGVSTGAIQSLFAVREDYAGMKEEYVRNDPLVNRGGLFTALFKGYLNDTAPLRARLERHLCGPSDDCSNLGRLAETRPNLLMGMVEARTGDFHVVDIGKMLREARAAGALDRPERAQRLVSCVVGVALGSSAVPLQLRPVRLHDPATGSYRTFTDGGVRLSVFDAYVSNMAALFSERKDRDVELYVVRNGPTVVEPSVGDTEGEPAPIDRRPNAPAVAMKSYATIVNQTEVMSIASLRLNYPTGLILVATADGYNTGGLAWRTSERCPKPGGKEKENPFNNAFMRCLAAWGADKAEHHGTPWIELSEIKPTPSPTPSGG